MSGEEVLAVILDLGGVLLSYVGGETFDRRWEDRLGLDPGTCQRELWDRGALLGADVGRITESEWWSGAMQTLKVETSVADEMYEDWLSLAYLNDEVAAWVESLRPRYRLASLSNAYSDARRGCIERYKLDQIVDLMVFSAEEGMAKPDPAIYTLTLQRLGVPAPSAVFFDDRLENVEPARDVGMTAVQVRSSEELLTEGRRLLG